MAVIRLQENTPSIYCNQSRDFQLLCRLYDCVINGVKYDIDSLKYLTDTHRCRASTLPLLQTKLGFFTSKNYDDKTLRYVLEAFPSLVKNKGSLLAVKQALNVFLKINNLNIAIDVSLTLVSKKIDGRTVRDHTVIIGLDISLKNVDILEDMLRYVLPSGFEFYLYYYNTVTDPTPYYIFDDEAILLFVTDGRSAELRSSDSEYSTDAQNRLIGAVDTHEIIGLGPVYPEGSKPKGWKAEIIEKTLKEE